jgi:hypothetical protein
MVSDKGVARFLYELMNGERSYSWFESHPLFGALLPRPHIPEHRELRIWRDVLRHIWTMRSEKARHRFLTDMFVAYVRDLPRSRAGREFVVEADGFCDVLIRAAGFVPAMRWCANPSCSRPYFFAERRSQKICLEPDCRSWADRKYKRSSWKKHGREWRAPKAKGRSKTSKSRRKEK